LPVEDPEANGKDKHIEVHQSNVAVHHSSKLNIQEMNMAQKNTLKFAESVLIPIIISQDGTITVTDEKTVFSTQERKQAFLVHLQIGKMAVTVYTSKAFAEDGDVEDPEPDANLRDTNSDELNESGDEFQIP